MTDFEYINLDRYDPKDTWLETAYQLKRIADILNNKPPIAQETEETQHTTKGEDSTK